MISESINIDNMEYMASLPDKFFDLIIADPPYGDFNGTIERTGGSWSKKYQRDKTIKKWDYAPSKEYFDLLFLKSKNQIIWGGNYFALPPSKHFLIWEKISISEAFSMAMVEYAWSSFDDNAKLFKHRPQRENGIHPTQKPIQLYKWILKNYAKEGDKIFDPNMGSQSSRIAAYDMKFDYWGCELDPDYYEAGNKRFENFKLQQKLF